LKNFKIEPQDLIPDVCIRVTDETLTYLKANPRGYPKDLSPRIDLCTLMALFSINWQLNQPEVLYLLYNSLEAQCLFWVGYEPKELRDSSGEAYKSYMEPWGYRVFIPPVPIMILNRMSEAKARKRASLERTRVKQFVVYDDNKNKIEITL